jgi:hypothetical protein
MINMSHKTESKGYTFLFCLLSVAVFTGYVATDK